eukprot:TRINITY_DN2897_c1_g1_i3.p1 TRINITY_DN2897_c1_g1~~TRINITY_DN2897_c1_g1_i3.p1  ORF type:complete len:750 (-),score=176.79 TRINITY_DN2897_c1_g1_i3:38-2287(-)
MFTSLQTSSVRLSKRVIFTSNFTSLRKFQQGKRNYGLSYVPIIYQNQAKRNNYARNNSSKRYQVQQNRNKFWFSGYATTTLAFSLLGWMSSGSKDDQTEKEEPKVESETEDKSETDSKPVTNLRDLIKNRKETNSPISDTWDLESYLSNATAKDTLEFIKAQYKQAHDKYGKKDPKTFNAKMSELELLLLMRKPSSIVQDLTSEYEFAKSNFGEETFQTNRALLNLTKVYMETGDHAEAKACFEKLMKNVSANNELSWMYPKALDLLGTFSEILGRFNESENIFQGELQLANDLEDEKLIAQAHYSLGRLSIEKDDIENAEKHLNKAASLFKKLARHIDLHKTNEIIALLTTQKDEDSDESELDRAEKMLKEAYDWNLRTFGFEAPRVWLLEDKFGHLLFLRNKITEAESHFRSAERGLIAIYGEALPIASPVSHLAHILINEQRFEEAEEKYSTLERIFKSEIESKPYYAQPLSSALQFRAICLLAMYEGNKSPKNKDKLEKSTRCFEESIKLLEDLDPDSPELARHYMIYARVLSSSEENIPRAAELSERAMTIFSNSLEDSHPQMINALLDQASILYLNGDKTKAEASFRRSLKAAATSYGFQDDKTINVVARYFQFLASINRTKDAEDLVLQALSRLNKQEKNYDRFAGILYYFLARSSLTNHKYRDAERTLSQALPCFEKSLGPGNPTTIEARLILASLYVELNQPKKAMQLITDLEKYYKKSGEPVPDEVKELISRFKEEFKG